MKQHKLIHLVLIFLTALNIVSGCRKDFGNYDYKKLPDFYTEGGTNGGTVTVRQSVEELVIDPGVVYNGSSELEYSWTLYYLGPSALSMQYPNDTVSREPVLRTLVNRPVGTSLRLLFTATEKSTGIIVYKEYRITVAAGIPTGWMVAHEIAGETDVDLILHPHFISGAKDTVYRNMYAAANGRKLPGSPVALGSGVRSINYILTTSGGATVRYTNFEHAGDYADLISHLSPGVYKPEGLFWFQTSTNVLYNDGTLYSYDNSDAIKMSARAYPADGKGYRAAPFHAIAGANAAVFYDKKNLRMMHVPYSGLIEARTFSQAQPTARFSLDSIGKTVLFLGNGFGTVNGGRLVYAFFKDVDNDSKRYLYVMATQRPAQPDVAMIDISDAPDIANAKFYAFGQGGPVAYYATDSNIYLMQINAAGNTVVNPSAASFAVPAGETITALNLYNNTTMWIATWNEAAQEGKLYMMSVTASSGVINPAPVQTYDQFGKIGAMEFKRY